MNAAVAAGLARELARPSPCSAILAAVDPAGVPLGFVSLRTARDYLTEVPVGHVVDLVVAPAAEGRGVGRASVDRAGLLNIGRVSLALDPKVYAYGTRVYVSQLFTVEGMR